jgi:hypothetical protein
MLIGVRNSSIPHRALSQPTTRPVVHANDGYESHVPFLITPEIPLTDLELTSVPTMIPSMLGYHHHGVEYWQYASPPSDSTTVQCDMSGEDPKCSLSVPSRGITIAHTNVSVLNYYTTPLSHIKNDTPFEFCSILVS